MSQPTQTQSNPRAVVIDSNILISICSREPTHQTAKSAFSDYAAKGWRFYAPGAILTEVLFILCKKLQDGLLTEGEHQKAVKAFNNYMKSINPAPQGDIGFILRAEEIRKGYSCLHSADGFFIALTEELAKGGPAELLTFDKRLVNVAASNAPTIIVNLLPS